MNYWKQTRTYACLACGTQLLHDRMHNHVLFKCPRRPMPKKGLALAEKAYRPAIGGEGR